MAAMAEQPKAPTSLSTSSFPPYFAITGCIKYSTSHNPTNLYATCCIAYGRKIQCILRTRWGVEIMRGLVNHLGVTILDRVSKKSYCLSYRKIKERYGLYLNYETIQSLLLGLIDSKSLPPRQANKKPHGLPKTFFFHHITTGEVMTAQLINFQETHVIQFVYHRKTMALGNHFTNLVGLDIYGKIRKQQKNYAYKIIWQKLKFRPFKKSNTRPLQ